MRQFDVFENPAPAARRFAPYLVVVSSHYLSDLTEVVVAPLLRRQGLAANGLEITVHIADEELIFVISDLSSVSRDRFRRHVGDLGNHEDAIRRALDRLFTGF